MAAEQRKLLEQLMGDQLMNTMTTRAPALDITDPKVCRSYLAGSCPHDLFTNTKQDLGTCPKTHLPNLKEEYDKASGAQKKEWGFEWDYQREINKHITDCDHKIITAQKRLEKTSDEVRKTEDLLKQIDDLTRTIEAGLIEIEIMAETGSVNLAVQEFHKLRLAKITKEERERELKNLTETSGPSGHQKLQVCDTCGAYLSRLDNDRRLADHFFGKMHLGYAQMRKEYDRLSKELKGQPPPPRDTYADDGPRYDDGGYGGGGYGRQGGGYGGRGGRGGHRGRGGGYQRW